MTLRPVTLRLLRARTAGLLLVAVAASAAATPARADGDAYPGAYAGWIRTYGMPSIYRSGRYAPACGPAAIDRPYYGGCGCDRTYDPCRRWDRGAYGTPWSTMRRYLASDVGRPSWHRHPQYWWLRRWPCRYAASPGFGAHLCGGLEVGPDACPFAVAALADAPAAGETLSSEDRLVRGLERFHAGATDRAAEDFRAVTDTEPENARAWYGRTMTAFTAKDWSATADALRRLAALGALDAGDRIETEGGFEDRKRFSNLADAVVAHVAWNVHETDARLVAAWSLAADGRPEAARAHAGAALRANPDDAAAVALDRGLSAATSTTPAPAPVAEPVARASDR